MYPLWEQTSHSKARTVERASFVNPSTFSLRCHTAHGSAGPRGARNPFLLKNAGYDTIKRFDLPNSPGLSGTAISIGKSIRNERKEPTCDGNGVRT